MRVLQYNKSNIVLVRELLNKTIHTIDAELGSIAFFQHEVWQVLQLNDDLMIDDDGFFHVIIKKLK